MRKLLLVAAVALLGIAQPTRAQFCPGTSPWVFDDVPANDLFCGYITWAAQNGITLGCAIIDANNRLYCPNDAVTRSQMAAFVNRLGNVRVEAVGTGPGLTGGPITGVGTINLAATQLLPTTACTNNQIPKWNGSAWVCSADANSGGTVTSVIAGSGLTGGTITTAGTIAVDTSTIQSRVTGSCAAGNYISAIAANGTVTCQADNAGPANAFVQNGNAFGATAVLGTTDANAVQIKANNAAALTIMTNGRVGIGTPAPNEQLELTGNLRIPATTAVAGIVRQSTSTLLHTFGLDSLFVGVDAGNLSMTGGRNTGIGRLALNANTSGSFNTAAGFAALGVNSTGTSNTAVGGWALTANTTGSVNTGIGTSALLANTTGSRNTAIGGSALSSNNGDDNTAAGFNALTSNTTGTANSAIGRDALLLNTTGVNNTAVGIQSLSANTTGGHNTALGRFALKSSSTAGFNTAVGNLAMLEHINGSDNVAVGHEAMRYGTDGTANTAVGTRALANTLGVNNTAHGYEALLANLGGGGNTAQGYRALSSNTFGQLNAALGNQALINNTTADGNAALGDHALASNTTGDHNTAVGRLALFGNVTGSDNTALGHLANVASSALVNATAIGAGAIVDASSHVRIGNTGVTQIGGQVAWSNLSDRREKKDIRDVSLGLDFVMSLRPVEYRMRNGNDRLDLGFVAQEVEALLGTGYNVLGIGATAERKLSLRYTDLIAPMVKAIQEQQALIARQSAEMAAMRDEVAAARAVAADVVALKSALAALQRDRAEVAAR